MPQRNLVKQGIFSRMRSTLAAVKEKKNAMTGYSKASIDRTEIVFPNRHHFQTPKGKKALEILYRNSWAIKRGVNVRANLLSFRGMKINITSDKQEQVITTFLKRMHPTRPMLALSNTFRQRSIDTDVFGMGFDELLYDAPIVADAKDLLGFSALHPMNTDFIRNASSDIIKFKEKDGKLTKIPEGWVWRQNPDDEMVGVPLELDRVASLKYNLLGDELWGISSIEPVFKTAENLRMIEEGMAQGVITYGNPTRDFIVGDESHPPTKKMIDNTAEAVKDFNNKSEYVHPAWIRVGQLESFSLSKIPTYVQPYISAISANFEIPEFILTGRGEGCYSSDTQTLTEDGWKFYWEIDQDEDKIATYNPDTNKLEYHKPTGFSLYKHTGKVIHFKNSVTDVMVTSDHKMFVSPQSDGRNSNNWQIIEANDIEFSRFHFKNNLEWQGIASESVNIPEVKYDPQSRIKNEGDTKISTDIFMEFLGYYISEGSHSGENKNTYKIEIWQEPGEKQEKMKAGLEKLPFKINFEDRRFRWASKSLYFFLDQFGNCSHNKRIPKWIKKLPSDKLQILLDALILGDGTRHSEFNENSTTICYYTTSKQLADDVSEIMLKTGHVVNMRVLERDDRLPLFRIYGNLSWKDSKFLKDDIKEIDYDDMVYCFQVPNHLFITKRNGKIAIQGNTNKATAQAMINFVHQTIDPLQQKQAMYFEEHILAPLMKLNNIEEIPTIEWNEILPKNPNDYANIIKVVSEAVIGGKHIATVEEMREWAGLGSQATFKKPIGSELPTVQKLPAEKKDVK